MKFKNKNIIKDNRGYTLLFAVLVSSLVLAVGISILTISKKEFLLSSAARESVYAFYAADTGLECAVYWDSKGKFATSTLATLVSCGDASGQPIVLNSDIYGPYTTIFHVKNSDNRSCAIVSIRQEYKSDASNNLVPVTTIESRGYNTGWDNASNVCNESPINPKRVERAIRYSY